MAIAHQDIPKFVVAGINYKKANTSVRSLYAINTDSYLQLLADAPKLNIKELFVLSTCNRTEIYAFCDDENAICELLCNHTIGDLNGFKAAAYIKNGKAAIEHLFNVSAGLDSQILGDYEILGQIKLAVKIAKENNCVCAYMERLINVVLQSSKEIKTNTLLSGGTVSVSFAAVQYIKDNIKNISDKKIVLFGAGKIGKNTCKNLIDYLDTKDITLINRTNEKAVNIANELGLKYAEVKYFYQQLNDADIIVVATNSQIPIILKSHIINNKNKLIIDLSVPCNVDSSVKKLPQVTLLNLDELSKIKDETLQMRLAEMPKAKFIINKHIADYKVWHQMRKHVPVLKTVKSKLKELHKSCLLLDEVESNNKSFVLTNEEEKIQKVINNMAVKMREKNSKGCNYIEAMNEYIAFATN